MNSLFISNRVSNRCDEQTKVSLPRNVEISRYERKLKLSGCLPTVLMWAFSYFVFHVIISHVFMRDEMQIQRADLIRSTAEQGPQDLFIHIKIQPMLSCKLTKLLLITYNHFSLIK